MDRRRLTEPSGRSWEDHRRLSNTGIPLLCEFLNGLFNGALPCFQVGNLLIDLLGSKRQRRQRSSAVFGALAQVSDLGEREPELLGVKDDRQARAVPVAVGAFAPISMG